MSAPALSLQVERSILQVRDQRVMLDFQLAALYQVETRALKQAVRRNADRFPADFMFELTPGEIEDMVSQNVIPGLGKLGGAIPMAFRLRELLASNADLGRKLDQIEKKYDGQFRIDFDAIRQLMTPPPKSAREMGFHAIPPRKVARKPKANGA